MNELIENKKKSEILADEIRKMEYGEFISHQEISRIIDEPYPSNKYTSTIAKTKKILLKNYHIVIENIIGDGYRLIAPDDFVDQSLRHYKRGFNEMQKGSDTLQYAPTKDMTPEGRTIYQRVHDRTVTLQAAMKGVSVELKTLGQRNHPMNVENVGRR